MVNQKSKAKTIKESKPKDTVGEAVYTKLRIYKDFAFERLIIYIVTSDWHVSRAEEIFNFVYADNNTKLDFIDYSWKMMTGH